MRQRGRVGYAFHIQTFAHFSSCEATYSLFLPQNWNKIDFGPKIKTIEIRSGCFHFYFFFFWKNVVFVLRWNSIFQPKIEKKKSILGKSTKQTVLFSPEIDFWPEIHFDPKIENKTDVVAKNQKRLFCSIPNKILNVISNVKIHENLVMKF